MALTSTIVRILLVAGVLLIGVVATIRSATPGITFALEEDINLTIDSSAFFNGLPVLSSTWELKDLVPGVDKFFDLEGIVPGDSGQATISMHVESRQGSAWLCLDFTNLASDENGINEPESHEDGSAEEGELAKGLNVFAWHDDGDNTFEPGEGWLFGPDNAASALAGRTYPIADATTGAPANTNETRYIGLSWCAGDMSVNLATGEIECLLSGLSNGSQTDSMIVDIAIRAALERGRADFTCSGEVLPDGRERPDRPNFERPDRPEFERPLRDTRTSRPDREERAEIR